ncbi:MAG: hypothetical protein HXS54_15865 [Theionarchaea archaeon]|nr:hypothetical protein [Theionarchaea archaeon]
MSADKLSSIDHPSLFVECESAVLNSLVAKNGNFTRGKKRYILMVNTVDQYPGIRTTELMELLNIPQTTFYRMLRKAAYEDHLIERKGCRLYPITPIELPQIPREVHALTLRFPTYFNRTVVEALCAYLNESDLFNSQYIKAEPTSKAAKEENCRCITISCSSRPMNKEDLITLRALIWSFTLERFGRKVRMSVSRVEINKDYIIDFRGKNSKVPCQSMIISKLYRCLARGYFKRFPDGRVCFRSEVIDKFDDLDDLINTIGTHAEYHVLAKKNVELERTNSMLLKEMKRKDKQIKELKRQAR